MSASRPVRARFSALPPQPSHSTLTFLASWRGQLLICTVVLVLGFAYFIVRAPIASVQRRRQEALSAMRTAELVSEERKQEDERGRERKRDIKRRKGSLLKATSGNASGAESSTSALAGPSSLESSPPPWKLADLSPKVATKIRYAPTASPAKPSQRHPASDSQLPPSSAAPRSPPPPIHIPPVPAVHSTPWDIPLPESPLAGPSRLTDSDVSVDGESEMQHTDESTLLDKPKQSGGFSIIPEEGYLPAPQAPPSSSKKKRRKGKVGTAAAKSDAPVDPISPPQLSPPPPQAPSTPSRGHSRKASLGGRPANMDLSELLDERDRTIDILRAEIGQAKAQEGKAKEDTLRAAAAEERARSELDRARKIGNRNESEGRRRESELQARLQHLGGLHNAVLQRLAVLENILRETGHQAPSPMLPHGPISPMLGHSPGPPLSPFGMGYAPSPRNLTPSGGGFVPYPSPGMFPSPLLHPNFPHPPSPFRRPEMPGPGEDVVSLAGPLTPGHAGHFDVGAGTLPLRPHPRAASPIGLGLPNGSAGASGNAGPTADELRRISIQTIVMKAKPQAVQSEGSADSDPAADSAADLADDTIRFANDELHVIGMGNGVGNGHDIGNVIANGNGNGIEIENGNGNGNVSRNGNDPSSATSSLPTSPSPSGHRQMLLTPANAELFNAHEGSAAGLRGIRVVCDEDGSKTYYRDDGGSSVGSGSGDGELEVKERAAGEHEVEDRAATTGRHAIEERPTTTGGHARGRAPRSAIVDAELRLGEARLVAPDRGVGAGTDGAVKEVEEKEVEVQEAEKVEVAEVVEEVEVEDPEDPEDGEAEVPMFASLAHTPEQVAEMRRLRDRQIRARARSADPRTTRV